MYQKIQAAYEKQWGKPSESIIPDLSSDVLKDFPDLKILVFPPTRTQPVWIYATVGMFDIAVGENALPEIHLFSSEQNNEILVSALSRLMEYSMETPLEYGQIFSCGDDIHTSCRHLLATYPFADGEGFPELWSDDREILFIWLAPVTDAESQYLKEHGYESLDEKLFEREDVNFFDWNRPSVL